MQGDASSCNIILITFLEMPIHISIYQPKNNCFITHKRLVMTFTITNRFLIGTTIFHFPEYRTRLPVLVFLFFNYLYPIIWYIHCHPIVEPISSFTEWLREPRHTTNFFGNGYCM